jgi:hypothetical protein
MLLKLTMRTFALVFIALCLFSCYGGEDDCPTTNQVVPLADSEAIIYPSAPANELAYLYERQQYRDTVHFFLSESGKIFYTEEPDGWCNTHMHYESRHLRYTSADSLFTMEIQLSVKDPYIHDYRILSLRLNSEKVYIPIGKINKDPLRNTNFSGLDSSGVDSLGGIYNCRSGLLQFKSSKTREVWTLIH